MTDPQPAILHLPKCGPRTEPSPEWEASRHAAEASFWAEHLKEFEQRLARIRHHRGDERAALLVRDVLAEVKAAHSEEIAREARERLLERWRGAGRGP